MGTIIPDSRLAGQTRPPAAWLFSRLLERHTLHIMDDKQRIALVETVTINNKVPPFALPSTAIRYQFGNHLGTTCLELDETGAVITYEEYYPYGSSSYQAGRSTAEVSLKRYRYTAKERDKETGLNYYGARYYASWISRWISCDPKYLIDGPNLYCYAMDRPTTYSDRTGTQSGFGPMGPPMPEPDIFMRAQLWELAVMRKDAEKELELHLSAGNTGHESEVQLAELEQKSSILNASLNVQLVLTALGAVRNGLSTRAPTPSEPRPPDASEISSSSPTAVPTNGPKLLTAGAGEQQKLLPAGTVAPEPKLLTAGSPAPAQQPSPGKVPPQFRVGKAGETMAAYSLANSPVGGPSSLAEGQFTLKNASGKTALPSPTSNKGARKPDMPIRAGGGAVGTVEVKTPFNSAPEDPVDYVRARPYVANQMRKEQDILGQGGITWGPAGGPQTPVDPGEGIGLSTAYWSPWKPPWDIQ